MVHKIYQLYKLFHQYLKLFPKTEKYSLGQRIETVILELLELVLWAANSNKLTKQNLLPKASCKANLLKVLIRLAYEIKAIDSEKYIALEEDLQEIGRMLGGWLRYLNR